MEKVRDIYNKCNSALNALGKKFQKGIVEYQDSLESPTKSDFKKLNAVQNAFTQFQTNSAEMKVNAKHILSLIKTFNKTGEGIEDIEDIQRDYSRNKTNSVMQIGFISKAISTQVDIDFDDEIEKFMEALDQIPRVNSMLQTTEVAGGLDDLDLEDDAFLFDNDAEESTKSPPGSEIDEEFVDEESVDGSADESGSESGGESADKPINQEEWDNEIKQGGLNKESDQYVTIGGNDVVVGERAKFCIRQKILLLKQANDQEEQLEILGAKDEEELQERCKQILESPEDYVKALTNEYGLADLTLQALDDLKERVKAGNKALIKSKSNIPNVEKKISTLLDQIEKAQEDPLNLWHRIKLQPQLYKIVKCVLALTEQKVVSKCKSKASIKKLYEQTLMDVKELKEEATSSSRENPGKWEDEFTVSRLDTQDPIKCIAKIEKSLAPQLTELEVYFACVSEYLDQQWNLRDTNMIKLKYRVYLMTLIKNCPIEDDIKGLAKLLKVKNYSDFSKFVSGV